MIFAQRAPYHGEVAMATSMVYQKGELRLTAFIKYYIIISEVRCEFCYINGKRQYID